MTKFFTFTVFILFFVSCSNEPKKNPTTDAEVATTFIRNILDDNFKEAEIYILQDEINTPLFKRFKLSFESKPKDELKSYKGANITIKELKVVGDSVRLIDYSNSFRKEVNQKLKLVWSKDKWLVDFKYSVL